MKKVIIAGGRDFRNYTLLKRTCDLIVSEGDEIVSGGQKTEVKDGFIGADYFGEVYAKKNGNPIKKFEADWNTHGKSAGPIRNEEMAKYADVLIAFWDGKSKGTKSMIDLARKHKLSVYVIKYNQLL